MLASPGGGSESEAERSNSLVSREDRVRNMEAESRTTRLFTKLYILSLVIGILIIGMICIWIGVYRGGYATRSNPKLEFNWHPLLMTTGLIFLYGNGALIYRAFRAEKKKKLKIAHALVHVGAFVFVVGGLVAVFDSHNLNTDSKGLPTPMPNLYSLHSWIGLTAVILFACQWICGFTTFLFPGLRPAIRNFYLPVHQFFGVAIFVLAVGTALIGLNEKAIFSLSNKYGERDPEGVLMNMIGLLLICFAGLVVFLLTVPLFRRKTSEEELLLTNTNLE